MALELFSDSLKGIAGKYHTVHKVISTELSLQISQIDIGKRRR
jgi:hypothetical protein